MIETGTIETATDWHEIRGLFALDPETTHLNTGTIGAMPHEVVDTYVQETKRWTGTLANIYPPSLYPEYRRAIALDYGVDQDELTICHNATESVSRIIAGLDLGADDEVITTTHECFSVLSNFNLVHNRHGLTVKLVTPPVGSDITAEEIVALFEAAITPRTKLLSFAAVTLFTGTRMPIRALCDLAQRHGLMTMIDGALMPGMLNADLRALGVDFMAGSGSKFQCGPLGTGLLYARNKIVPEYNPLPLPTFWPVISTWYPLVGPTPRRTNTEVETYNMGDYLQSAGSASIARAAALAKACEVWNRIGRQRIEDRIMELGRYAKRRVIESFGEKALFSPVHDDRLHAPLVAFTPFKAPEDAWNITKICAFTDKLETDHRIWVRWVDFEVPGSPHMHYAARICTHLFNSHEEIDRAVKTMVTVADELA